MHSLLGPFGQDEYFKVVSPGSCSCPATILRSVVQAGAGECNARPLFCACLPCIGCGACPGCSHQCLQICFPPTHPAICFGMLVARYGACPKAVIEHPKSSQGWVGWVWPGVRRNQLKQTCSAVCLQQSPQQWHYAMVSLYHKYVL